MLAVAPLLCRWHRGVSERVDHPAAVLPHPRLSLLHPLAGRGCCLADPLLALWALLLLLTAAAAVATLGLVLNGGYTSRWGETHPLHAPPWHQGRGPLPLLLHFLLLLLQSLSLSLLL